MGNNKTAPVISIVGRPNVGKSSLFNRLAGERKAVVVEQSGTTRDKVEAVITLGGVNVKIVDTGGYLSREKDELSLQVQEQIYGAMDEADVILMVTDASAGVSPYDKEVGGLLRKFGKNIILVANKADNNKLQDSAVEFFQLGFGEPEATSCLHSRGLRSLKSRIVELLRDDRKNGGDVPDNLRISGEESDGERSTVDERVIKIAVVGRPNVGKSSFINNLLKRDRGIVSEVPGTTRDSIDTFFRYEEDDYILVDTAGIRHKRKVKNAVDVYSMMRSRETIAKADVVLLLLDSAEGITRDDIGILKFVEEKGKACLIAVNKWDLAEDIEDITTKDYEKHLVSSSNELKKFPIHFVSSITGKNVVKTLSIVKTLNANLDLSASTSFLNKIFEKADPANVPIPRRKIKPNFLYIIQYRTRPVVFKYFVNNPANVLPAHCSYIENQLRANLSLSGIPIKILFARSRKESRW